VLLPSDAPVVSIALCSDGVWDNWLYEDVTNFVLDPACVSVAINSASGCSRINNAFMQRNDVFAKQNFGSHADNATCVLLYISDNSSFPSSMNPTARMIISASSKGNSNSQNSSPNKGDQSDKGDKGAGAPESSGTLPKKSKEVEESGRSSNTALAAGEAKTSLTTAESPPSEGGAANPSPSSATSTALENADSVSLAIAELAIQSLKISEVTVPNSSGAEDFSSPTVVQSSCALVDANPFESGAASDLPRSRSRTPTDGGHITSPRLAAAGALVMAPN
jgi:hypothetical protein